MSFDIFLQAFENGAAARRNGAEVRRLLLGERQPSGEVYGVPEEGAAVEGLMFSHVPPGGFDLLVEVARVADLVVMPVGCPVCLIDEAQREHLPPELAAAGVRVVTTGDELRRVVESD